MSKVIHRFFNTFVETMVHQGEILDKRIKEKGIPIIQIAKMIGVNRATIHNAINSAQVKPKLLLSVGKIIGHNFAEDFREFSELRVFMEPQEPYGNTTPERVKWLERELEVCKVRCFDLAEENKLLLQGQLHEYFKRYGKLN